MTTQQSYHDKIIELYKGTKALIGEKESFSKKQIPTRKNEAWKYSDVRKLLKIGFVLPEPKLQNVSVQTSDDEYLMLFVNGIFDADKSVLPKGKEIAVCTMKEAVEEYKNIISKYLDKTGISEIDIFTAQNAAFAQNGVFIYLNKNVVLAKPLKILQVFTEMKKNVIIQNRNLVILDEGSKAEIHGVYQCRAGNRQVLVNQATEVFVAKNAHLTNQATPLGADPDAATGAPAGRLAGRQRVGSRRPDSNGRQLFSDLTDLEHGGCHCGQLSCYGYQ